MSPHFRRLLLALFVSLVFLFSVGIAQEDTKPYNVPVLIYYPDASAILTNTSVIKPDVVMCFIPAHSGTGHRIGMDMACYVAVRHEDDGSFYMRPYILKYAEPLETT